jgi:hypothetical protein
MNERMEDTCCIYDSTNLYIYHSLSVFIKLKYCTRLWLWTVLQNTNFIPQVGIVNSTFNQIIVKTLNWKFKALTSESVNVFTSDTKVN